ISSPANGATTPAGTNVTLAATATDDFDGNVSGGLQWNSSRDGLLGGGASLTVRLSEGMHTLTASATDSDGATRTAQAAFTVTATPPLVTIIAPANQMIVNRAVGATFVGAAADATDGDLIAALRWMSDRDGLIGQGASFSTLSL